MNIEEIYSHKFIEICLKTEIFKGVLMKSLQLL